MAEKRSSLGSQADSNNSSSQPRGSKRRRTMLDSVAEVAKWLLPSWASEHETIGQMSAGARIPFDDDQPTASGVSASSGLQGRPYGGGGGGSSLRNGDERGSKRARLNNDLRPHEASRREVIMRLSPVTAAASPPASPSTDDAGDLDDGSDSSTSGCSSLSLAATSVPTSSGVNIPEGIDHRSKDQSRALNRPTSSRSGSFRPPQQTAAGINTDNGNTRDVSIGAQQTEITAETSSTGPGSLNFSLFSRPSRALSSTLNTTLPLTGKQNRLLSSSLHKPERSLNRSIFYDGKTTYGGAAAHRKLNLFSPSPYQMSATRSKAPSNVRVQGQNSSAKRLIQALERINTPVQNAKRIPMGRPDSVTSQDSELRRKEALESIASLRQNMPPTLSTCRTPVENAKIGSNVTSAAQHDYTLDLDREKVSVSSAVPSSSLVTSTPSTHHRVSKVPDTLGTDKGGGKMKHTKSIHAIRKPLIPEEEPAPEEPDLVNVPLPIKTLPQFNFSTKPPVAVALGTESVPKAGSVRSPLTSLADFSNKPFEKSSVPPVCPGADSTEVFTFARPVSLAKPTELSSSKEEEFKFKHPIYLNKSGSTNPVSKTPAFTITAPTMIVGNPGSLKVKEVYKVPAAQPAELATSGSVLDALANPEKKDKITNETSDWGSQFRKAPGQWDCPTCLVTNGPNDDRCKACETKNPATAARVAPTTQSIASSSAPPNQWGDLFKKAPGTWACDDCMLSNNSEATSCVACSKPKPGAKSSGGPMPTSTVKPASPFGGIFVMPGWKCDKCPQTNEIEAVKCAGCEASKPGQVEPPSTSGASTPSSGFKFGLPSTPLSTSTNTAGSSSSIPFGQGTTADKKSEGTSASTPFKFGAPSKPAPIDQKDDKSKEEPRPVFAAPTNDPAPAITFKVADIATANAAPTEVFGATFRFGAPSPTAKPAENKTLEDPKTANSTPAKALFTFGVSSSPTISTPATAVTGTAPTPSPSFTFGTPAGFSTPVSATASAATFSFGKPAALGTTATSSSAPTSTTFSFGTPTLAGVTASAATPTVSDTNVKTETSVGPISSAATIGSGLFGSGTLTAATPTTTSPMPFALPASSTTTMVATTASLTTPISSTFSFTPLNAGAAVAPSTQPSAAAVDPESATPTSTTANTTTIPQVSKPVFAFNATAPSAPSGLTTTTTTATTTTSLATTPAATAPAESMASKTSTVSSSPFVFGTSNNASSSTPSASSAMSTGYNFGAAVSAASPTMFTFGQRPASATTGTTSTPAPGAFGTPVVSTTTPAGSTFGALATSTPAQSSTTVFGGGTASSNSLFQFGAVTGSTAAVSPVTAAPAASTVTPRGGPSFVFGQPPAGSSATSNTVTGGQQTMFAFGSNAATSQAAGGTNNNNGTATPAAPTAASVATATAISPFGFGGNPTMSSPAPATGNDMFKFGTPTAAPTATSTFPFGAQQSPALPGTGNTPFLFGATPASPAAPGVLPFMVHAAPAADNPFSAPTMAGRKVKRAVRRKPGPR